MTVYLQNMKSPLNWSQPNLTTFPVVKKIKQISTILGTLDMSKADMPETKLCNTLRIISNYLNSFPYLVQFVGGPEQGAASGANKYLLELQYLAPISCLNPKLENSFSLVLAQSINQVQASLLRKSDLVHKTFTTEIVPRILLTLDRKRLKPSDIVNVGDVCLIHTSGNRNKHS